MKKLQRDSFWPGVLWSLVGLLVYVLPARADNCGSLSDCFYTVDAAVNAGFALAIIGILVRIFLSILPKQWRDSIGDGLSHNDFEGEKMSHDIRTGFVPKQKLPIPLAKEVSSPPGTTITWDNLTNSRINNLHPDLRSNTASFIQRVDSELGVKLRITDGVRTVEEQNELFEQGRTKTGQVVTHAKGGESFHNVGRAFDVSEITSSGQLNYDLPWDKIAKIGRELGFEWGGEWAEIVDKPHFQMTGGKSVKQWLDSTKITRQQDGTVSYE